jgi:hypothetical protein
MDELSAHQRDILDFEAGTFGGAGSKEQAIRGRFGLGATNYYQQLNALLDSEAALAHNPVLVNRLRRLRARNQRSRSARRTDTTAPTKALGPDGPSDDGPALP